MRRYSIAALVLVLCAVTITYLCAFAVTPQSVKTSHYNLHIEELVTGLEHPWSLAFLPDGRMLVTERSGRLLILSNDGQTKTEVMGLPPIAASGQGGLLDVTLHPDFAQNQLIYFSYSATGSGGVGTEVARAQLSDKRLIEVKTIFQLQPKSGTGRHFGSRLVFDRQGLLYISLGDRGDKDRAQRLDDHAGSVIRLHADGRIPDDNPFLQQDNQRKEIYTYGHRNIQGAALHPKTGKLWVHEHGPQGGDEVNIIQSGNNYGWPVITYGVNYGSGTQIGEGTHKAGMAQPIHTWVPSIAPSGMLFYDGDKFPQWQGHLFVGALKDQMLVRLELEGEKIVNEERMLKKALGRIRDVRQGPDGYIYLLTDHADGKLVRIKPEI